MRGVLVLLVSVALAGCLEEGSPPRVEPAPLAPEPSAAPEESAASPAAPPTQPLPTSAPPDAVPTPRAPAGSTPPPPTGTPPLTTPTPPSPPTKDEEFNEAETDDAPPSPYRAFSTGGDGHDHAQDAPGTMTFTIPAGHAHVALRVTFMPDAPAPLLVAPTATVTLVSPTGDVATCSPSAPVVPSAGESCAKTVSAKPGTWGVRFDGVGAVVSTAAVDVA